MRFYDQCSYRISSIDIIVVQLTHNWTCTTRSSRTQGSEKSIEMQGKLSMLEQTIDTKNGVVHICVSIKWQIEEVGGANGGEREKLTVAR